MKTLKLDHQLAQDVIEGRKTSTWRINDDKDLHVNDEVSLIDKVDPNNPASWRVIGTAHILNILEKQLGAVTAADMEGQERFTATKETVKEFQHYYGPQVDTETPLKMIRFTFKPTAQITGEGAAQSTIPLLTQAKLYTDGGSRGNPGPSASGYVILDMNDKILTENGLYLGVTTNNQAEYTALKIGLEDALKRGIEDIAVFMDSMLIVNQMNGSYKVKNQDLLAIHLTIKELATRFEKISYTHVPREFNKLADAMVNEVLDANS